MRVGGFGLPRSALCAGALAALAAALGGCGEQESGFARVPSSASERFTGPLRSDARVGMREISFSPQRVRLAPDGRVTWVNRDRVAHTVTDGTRLQSEFDSKAIEPGERYERSFGEPGRIDYRCTIHANMEGSLRVER